MFINIKKILSTCIILIWVILFTCNIIALVLPNIFYIPSDSSHLNVLSEFVDLNYFTKLIAVLILSPVLLIPYILTIYEKKWFTTKYEFYKWGVLLFINAICKISLPPEISFIIELSIFLVYPSVNIYCTNKDIESTKWLNPTLSYVFIAILSQILEIKVRHCMFVFHTNLGCFNNIIYVLDLAIIVYLYYFYVCFGGGKHGSILLIFIKRGISTIRSISQNIKRRSRKNKNRKTNNIFERENKRT